MTSQREDVQGKGIVNVGYAVYLQGGRRCDGDLPVGIVYGVDRCQEIGCGETVRSHRVQLLEWLEDFLSERVGAPVGSWGFVR